MDDAEKAAFLRELANDKKLLWDVARAAIELTLVDFRDSRLSVLGRNNGLVIKEYDGKDSSVIRFGSEMAVSIALDALADHIEKGS